MLLCMFRIHKLALSKQKNESVKKCVKCNFQILIILNNFTCGAHDMCWLKMTKMTEFCMDMHSWNKLN